MRIAAIILAAAVAVTAVPVVASAQDRCAAQADSRGLRGEPRQRFMAECRANAAAPQRPGAEAQRPPAPDAQKSAADKPGKGKAGAPGQNVKAGNCDPKTDPKKCKG